MIVPVETGNYTPLIFSEMSETEEEDIFIEFSVANRYLGVTGKINKICHKVTLKCII
jgi:hypothetical protein